MSIKLRVCRVGWGSGMGQAVLILVQQDFLGITPQGHAKHAIHHVLPVPTPQHHAHLVHLYFISTTDNASHNVLHDSTPPQVSLSDVSHANHHANLAHQKISVSLVHTITFTMAVA